MVVVIPGSLRADLIYLNLADLDRAARFAATELTLYVFMSQQFLPDDDDSTDRHYGNFLAWADTVFSGINDLVRSEGNRAQAEIWEAFKSHDLRQPMKALRNRALKKRERVLEDETLALPNGEQITLRDLFFVGGWNEYREVRATSIQYMGWILDEVLPFAVAIRRTKFTPVDASIEASAIEPEQVHAWDPDELPELKWLDAARWDGL